MIGKNLNFRKLGKGYPLIILHGLYGSGSNWLSIGKELSGLAEVYLVDLRNHGDSPHSDEHNYPAMMDDVIQFMDQQEIRQAVLLGHSMGGKVAIYTAVNHPERINRLVVADISPLPYDASHPSRNSMGGHQKILDSLGAVDLSKYHTLREIDQVLEIDFPQRSLRQFLMKNLDKDEGGHYFWKINLQALRKNLGRLAEGLDLANIPMEGIRQFPVLFIRGENSDYIEPVDERAIKRIFPLAGMVSLKDAGHWLHAEQPDLFVKTVKRFLIGQ